MVRPRSEDFFNFIVTGGRYFQNQTLLEDELGRLVEFMSKGRKPSMKIGDCPRGVDFFAKNFAQKKGWVVRVFAADWELEGKSAGPLRNRRMCQANGGSEVLLAFPGGKGTRNCIKTAELYQIPVYRIEFHATINELTGEETIIDEGV